MKSNLLFALFGILVLLPACGAKKQEATEPEIVLEETITVADQAVTDRSSGALPAEVSFSEEDKK